MATGSCEGSLTTEGIPAVTSRHLSQGGGHDGLGGSLVDPVRAKLFIGARAHTSTREGA